MGIGHMVRHGKLVALALYAMLFQLCLLLGSLVKSISNPEGGVVKTRTRVLEGYAIIAIMLPTYGRP